jgi:hypothetical protein
MQIFTQQHSGESKIFQLTWQLDPSQGLCPLDPSQGLPPLDPAVRGAAPEPPSRLYKAYNDLDVMA